MDATYVKLIRSIGIPGIIKDANEVHSEELMNLARINKIQLIYALTINSPLTNDLMNKYNVTVQTVCELSDAFNANSINYTIFKTIKPFAYTPSDIDVLVSFEDRELASDLLLKKGYTQEIKDAMCITMRGRMDIDLYVEPSVSNIAYLRRDALMSDTNVIDVNGTKVSVLANHAEFIAVMSHSLYKEQMLTLNDYYTLTILAEQTNTDKILKIAQDTNTVPVLRLITGICRNITEEVFGKSQPLKICRLAEELGATLHSVKGMPYKFSMKLAMGLLLRKILNDPDENSNLLKGVVSGISLRRARKFWDHMRRETY